MEHAGFIGSNWKKPQLAIIARLWLGDCFGCGMGLLSDCRYNGVGLSDDLRDSGLELAVDLRGRGVGLVRDNGLGLTLAVGCHNV